MRKVAGRAREAIFSAGYRLVQDASRRPGVRRLYYELRNRRGFSDLYQHDKMLADRERVEVYRQAISKHVRKGDAVVDLGTGTGVLAMFAARAGARVVHAIEHGPIIEAAQAIARDNCIDQIRFHRMHSRSFTLHEPADVIVHEQIGEAVFDEHAIANVSDLRDRILRPGGTLIPCRAAMFIEPIQMRADSRIPFSYEQELDGISFRSLKAVADAQPLTYRYKTERRLPVERLLCDPQPVVVIDFRTARPGDLPNRISYEREVIQEGSFDGFCVYFRLDFDDDLSYINPPDRPGVSWATPWLRMETRAVRPGDTIGLDLEAEDLTFPDTWRWTTT